MIPIAAPVCQYCLSPMQKWKESVDEQGKVLAVSYLCSCQGPIRYENYYAGDRHQETKHART